MPTFLSSSSSELNLPGLDSDVDDDEDNSDIRKRGGMPRLIHGGTIIGGCAQTLHWVFYTSGQKCG